jgi:hypothetical protein
VSVSADDEVAHATLRGMRQFAAAHPTVFLPTHDRESADRLSSRRVVDVADDQRR